MQIQIGSGPNITIHEALATEISSVVEGALSRYSDHITRVGVHLSDENSDKKIGHDTMRCMLEARLEGRQPIAVTHQASTVDQAVDGATDKLTRLIENIIERQLDQRRVRTDPPPRGQELQDES